MKPILPIFHEDSISFIARMQMLIAKKLKKNSGLTTLIMKSLMSLCQRNLVHKNWQAINSFLNLM